MRTAIILVVALLFLFAGLIYYLRNVYFYRDPQRKTPENPELLYSPCDGLVVYLERFEDGEIHSEKLGQKIHISEITGLKKQGILNIEEGWILGIYMSPLDVHFNYAPQSGKVKEVVYTPAKLNYPMVDLLEYVNMTFLRRAVDNFSKKFHLENERNTIVLDVSGNDVVLVEIADKFVNKIDCFVKEGDTVKAGQKISFIRRGSQVDVIVSRCAFTPLVKKGQRVTGGVTPIFKKM